MAQLQTQLQALGITMKGKKDELIKALLASKDATIQHQQAAYDLMDFSERYISFSSLLVYMHTVKQKEHNLIQFKPLHLISLILLRYALLLFVTYLWVLCRLVRKRNCTAYHGITLCVISLKRERRGHYLLLLALNKWENSH